MPSSMTGYGRGEFTNDKCAIVVDLKTINHRYLDISFRMPRSIQIFEEKCRNVLHKYINRGRVDLYIQLTERESGLHDIKLNRFIAAAYYDALKDLRKLFNIKEKISLQLMSGLPDVFQTAEISLNEEEIWTYMEKALEDAVSRLLVMRRKEGEKLFVDIANHLGVIEDSLERIKLRAPFVVEDYKSRLNKNLAELLPPDSLDEYQNRLLCEIVIYADKINIAEEIARLYSHLQQFKETSRQQGSIGRKLDFLLQEMNREINTIGSKANDYALSACVVEIKSELEQIREQIQNIE
ncbi:MAG: YicC/YloC family endoribonuclease [Bacillota bacterium]